MSMNAMFIQIEEAELAGFRADPASVEMLFEDRQAVPPAFTSLLKTAQDRMGAAGPQVMAAKLAQLDPRLRQQIEASMGRVNAAGGPEAVLKLMENRQGRGSRVVLSLDKAWHGVHYLLCGEVEPEAALLSQAVLGGVILGDDDEGFSGYGPARYFTAAQVAEFAREMSRPEVEGEAAARFDPARMAELRIYPGWRASDATWVMDGLRRLRDFYSDAAAHGRAVVTCLV